MTDAEIFQVIRTIVLTVTGVPECIRSNPNAPAPDGEYCAVSVTQGTRERGQANIVNKAVQQPDGTVLWEGVEQDVRSQKIKDVSLQFYRGLAHEYAEAIFECNKRPDIQALLFQNKIGWNRTGPKNNLNALQSANWESRAEVTVRLLIEGSTKAEVNGIYKVGVQVCDEDENLLEDIEVSQPVDLNYGGGYGAYQYGSSEYEPIELDP